MLQRAKEYNCLHLDSATATRVMTYHIGQPLECSVTHGLNTDMEIHLFINTMVYFHLNSSLYLLDKHLQSLLLTLLCLRGSVGYFILYLVVTAYISIATSHHSYLSFTSVIY